MAEAKQIVVPAILDAEQVRSRIYIVHGVPVMFDFDLARFYGIETRVLKQAVNRNMDSFPEDFMFRLSADEFNMLILSGVSQIVTPPGYNVGVSTPYVFTEQGVSMLSAILKSKIAVSTRVQIMRGFVAMHQMLVAGQLQGLEINELRARIEKLEQMMEINQETTAAIKDEVSNIYQAINALSAANQQPLPEVGYTAQRYQQK